MAASLHAEQGGECLFVQLRADDAQTARHSGRAGADVDLAGHMVKVQPGAVRRRNDALGAQHDAIGLAVVQCGEGIADLFLGELLRRLDAPALEDLVGVVAVMMVMMAAVVLMLIIVFIVVMMVMAVMLILVIMVMMVAAMMLVLVILVVIVMMMVMMVLFLVVLLGLGAADHVSQLFGERVLLLHGLEDLCAGELVPRRRDDDGVLVVLTQQGHSGGQLLLRDGAGAAEDNGGGGLDLVRVEFAKVLQIDLALRGIRHGDEAAERDALVRNTLYGADDVAEFADAGRLDEDAVGMIVGDDLLQRAAEVADERAADAAGVHLVDLNAGVLHEAAVNADLAELVFDEDDLFTLIGLADHLFNERGLARAEESGVNVNGSHEFSASFPNEGRKAAFGCYFILYYITRVKPLQEIFDFLTGNSHRLRFFVTNCFQLWRNFEFWKRTGKILAFFGVSVILLAQNYDFWGDENEASLFAPPSGKGMEP